MIGIRILLTTILFATVQPSKVEAHALHPGYLEITRLAGDSHRVFWRKPDVQGRPMGIEARLPVHCDPQLGSSTESDGQAWATIWITTCPNGLAGGEILIQGLERTQTDVLVRYESPAGKIHSKRLTPDRPSFLVPADPGAFDVFRTYLPLGVEHILVGADHLLFVFALLILISGGWRLVGAITAFTVAHSITMVAATLGWVALPGPPVEAVIALSIMFVASELLHSDGNNQRLSERYPWTLSFTFGLLHGFGFAGALREIGLPETDVPLALLSFNLGVEIGQLLFITVMLIIGFALRKALSLTRDLMAPRSATAKISAYVIGGVSAFWFIDRLSAF